MITHKRGLDHAFVRLLARAYKAIRGARPRRHRGAFVLVDRNRKHIHLRELDPWETNDVGYHPRTFPSANAARTKLREFRSEVTEQIAKMKNKELISLLGANTYVSIRRRAGYLEKSVSGAESLQSTD